MGDVRKNPSRSSKNPANAPRQQSNSKTIAERSPEEVKVDAREILIRALMMAGILLIAGFAMTLIASVVYDYKDLPHKGEIQYTSNNAQTFYPYYPNLRKFAIVNDPAQPGTESMFSKMGALGTGFFLYSVINTFHWIMEIGFSSLGNMILIPIIVLVVGSAVFYFKILPRSLQKPDNALAVGIGISMLHSLILVVLFILVLQISPTFHSVFRRPYFYSGDILVTTTRAGMPILLMTGFAYGAVAGGILYALVSVRRVLYGEESS